MVGTFQGSLHLRGESLFLFGESYNTKNLLEARLGEGNLFGTLELFWEDHFPDRDLFGKANHQLAKSPVPVPVAIESEHFWCDISTKLATSRPILSGQIRNVPRNVFSINKSVWTWFFATTSGQLTQKQKKCLKTTLAGQEGLWSLNQRGRQKKAWLKKSLAGSTP